jgi:hypothetical protein
VSAISSKKIYRIIDLDRRKIRSEILLFSLFFCLGPLCIKKGVEIGKIVFEKFQNHVSMKLEIYIG